MPTIITRGAASAKAFGFAGATGGVPVKQSQTYASPGTYTWVAPAGVTSISAVAVGAGGSNYICGCGFTATSGGGASLAYLNNFTVTPGNSYTVVVGNTGGSQGNGNYSGFNITSLVAGGGGAGTGSNAGTAWYAGGGTKQSGATAGGGGAGGYAGAGGAGGESGLRP